MNKITIKEIPKKILIIKPSSLGDIIHSLPFLDVIRDFFHDAEIHWVISKGLEGLLEDHPMVNKIWIINKDQWKNLKKVKNTVSEVRHLFRELRNEAYDMVIDLQGLLRSGLLTIATGAPLRIGFKEAREGSRFFYTHRVEGGKEIHAVDRYLKVAAFLGCDITDVCFPFPLSFNSSLVTRHLSLSEDYAVIVPGARWKTKIWPAERFGKLASLLPLKSLVIGSRADVDISNRVVECSGGNAISIAGRTDLKELREIMRGAKFVVSNDSGPMHIAAALGVPVFAIFGPTSPARTGPYGYGHVVIREEVSCAPCFKKRCKDTRCMDSVTIEKVSGIIKEKFKNSYFYSLP